MKYTMVYRFLALNLLALASVGVALADVTPSPSPSPSAPAITTVKAGMKLIGPLYKEIGANIKDPSKNALMAADAANLVIYFTAVQKLVPDSITELPAAQQPAALADFQSLIGKEINDATALQKAFEQGDNDGASVIAAQMGVIKKEGHSKFDPN